MQYKVCIKCKESLPLSSFHKHSKMGDGHLNKCKYCVLEAVREWRIKNPNARKEEHKRNAEKRGIVPRDVWLKNKKESAKGKRIVSNAYAHRRRLKVAIKDELTDFVFAEASRLRDMRKVATGIEWHIDHIVPLNHKNACGLHVAHNFQVVPAKWNLKKRNHSMDTYFEIAGY